MKEKMLRVQMLGGFAVYYGDEAVALNKIGSSKSVRMLQMLLLSMPQGISKNELMDTIYGGYEHTEAVNRNKNLNNLIYRLKNQLSACGMPKEEYVELKEGMCFFRSSMPVELDVQRFEKLVTEAKQSIGG